MYASNSSTQLSPITAPDTASSRKFRLLIFWSFPPRSATRTSKNTLLGAPRQLVCQCCGMPLEDAILSREPDGSLNEDYCQWCYAGGTFKYTSMEQLIDFCVEHMSSEAWSKEQVRAHMEAVVPGLKHWQK